MTLDPLPRPAVVASIIHPIVELEQRESESRRAPGGEKRGRRVPYAFMRKHQIELLGERASFAEGEARCFINKLVLPSCRR